MPAPAGSYLRISLFAAVATMLVGPLYFAFSSQAQVLPPPPALAVSLVAPSSGQQVTASPVQLQASVTGGSTLTTVTFNVNGNGQSFTFNGVPTATSSGGITYAFPWNVILQDNGSYRVTATAIDPASTSGSSVASSDGRDFSVALPLPQPVVALGSVPSVATGTVTLGASVQDPRAGGVVYFLLDGIDVNVHQVREASASGSTWTFAWNTASGEWPNGQYQVRAKYLFTEGEVLSSAQPTVTVANQTTEQIAGQATAPTLTLTSPSAGTYVTGSPMSLGATSSIPVSGLQFEFRVSGTQTVLLRGAGTSDQGLTWVGSLTTTDSLPVGVYEMRAFVMKDGIRYESAARSITISATSSGGSGSGSGTGETTTATFAILSTMPASGASFVSLPVPLRASTNLAASEMVARISSGTVAGFTERVVSLARTADGLAWEGGWYADGAPNGSYQVTYVATKDGVSVSAVVPFSLALPASTTTETAPTLFVAWVSPSDPRIDVTDSATLRASVSGTATPTAIGFAVIGGQFSTEAFLPAATYETGRTYMLQWNTASLAVGTYQVRALVKNGSVNVYSPDARTVVVTHPATSTAGAVSLLAPAAGATVSGTVAMRMTTVDGAHSAAFLFGRNDEIIREVPATFDAATSRWVAEFNTVGQVENGTYQFGGHVYDASGNEFMAGPVSLTVSNAATANTTETTTETAVVTPLVIAVTAPERDDMEVIDGAEIRATANKAIKSMEIIVSGVSSTTSTQPIVKLTPSYRQDLNVWIAQWSAKDRPAGRYKISAIAVGMDGVQRSADRYVQLRHPAATATTEPTTTVTTEPMLKSVAVVEPKSGMLGAPVSPMAIADGTATSVAFNVRSIVPGVTLSFKSTKDASGRWVSSTKLDPAQLKEGNYLITAEAERDGVKAVSQAVEFSIAGTTSLAPSNAGETSGDVPPVIAMTMPLPGQSLFGVAKLVAKTAGGVASVWFEVLPASGDAIILSRGASSVAAENAWVASFETTGTRTPDGPYRIRAVAKGLNGVIAAAEPIAIAIMNAVSTPRTIMEVVAIPVEVVKESVFQVPSGAVPVAVTPVAARPSEVVTQAKVEIAAECAERGIPAEKCAAWLASRVSDASCVAAGITVKEECLSYLRSKHDGQIPECRGVDEAACARIEERKTAGMIAAEKMQRIDAAVATHLNSTITVSVDKGTGRVGASSAAAPESEVDSELTDVLPLRPSAGKASVAVRVHASPSYAETAPGTVVKRVPAVVLIDTDGDGLPDDVEKRLGTDPAASDTDGDGFDDGTEVRSGFDPLGAGSLEDRVLPVAPVDVAIMSGLPIEQPTAGGEASTDLAVESVSSEPAEATEGPDAAEPQEGTVPAAMVFKGKGTPGEIVTIFVYSYMPVVLTTTVGEDGTWTYDLQDQLADGRHEAYVTVTDETGKIQKQSSPLAFFVAEAQAATEEEYFGPNADILTVAEEPVRALYRYYALGAVGVVLLAVGLGFLIMRRPKEEMTME